MDNNIEKIWKNLDDLFSDKSWYDSEEYLYFSIHNVGPSRYDIKFQLVNFIKSIKRNPKDLIHHNPLIYCEFINELLLSSNLDFKTKDFINYLYYYGSIDNVAIYKYKNDKLVKI